MMTRWRSKNSLWSSSLLFMQWCVYARAAQYSCNSLNTGSDAKFSLFQSVGNCSAACQGFSFAILQGSKCFCSDFAPSAASAVAGAQCNSPCPGYPAENCGSANEGLFSYYQLAQASGTRGASSIPTTASSSSSSSSTPTSTPSLFLSTSTTPSLTSNSASDQEKQTLVLPPVTVTVAITPTPPTTTSILISMSTPRSISIIETSKEGPSNTQALTTFSSSRVVASTAQAESTAAPAGLSAASSAPAGFFSSPGKVAGTFVALAIVLTAAVAAAFIVFRRRKENHEKVASGATDLDRKTSDSSSKEALYGAPVMVSGQRQSQSASTAGMMSSKSLGHQDSWGGQSSRDFHPAPAIAAIMPVDQRLNPRPMLMRFDSNYSRHSLRDDEDYSRRVLTVVNPSVKNDLD